MLTYLPYGKTHLPIEAPAERIMVSRVDDIPKAQSGDALVLAAMAEPIGSARLCELAKGKKNCTLILSDHTRPVPSRCIVPHMLAELRKGNPDIAVTLLVATGLHRDTTADELRAKLGDDIVNNETIVVHNAFDEAQNVFLGTLPSGAPLYIDRLAVETDLLIAEGFIEPHFFAGFSGGRKSVLPGVCGKETVLGNHCGAFIASAQARTGLLDGNPIHIDMEAAAEMAHLAYIVNVVIDSEKNAAAAFAGDFRAAHAAGVDFLRFYCAVPAVYGDIVVTSNGGAPLDQNLYQCVKGMTAAEAACNPGGTIILCAEIADGMGGESFYQQLKGCESPAQLYEQFSLTPQAETAPDQWQSQILARVLMHHRVIVVTSDKMREKILEMKMEHAETLPEALTMAGEGTLTVIPDGVSLIVTK